MATCTQIRAQLAPLLKDRKDLADEVVADRGDLKELQSEVGHVNPTLLANARAKLTADLAKLKQIDDQISVLRAALEAQRCFVKQPPQILQIQHQNPQPPGGFADSGAATIVYGKPSPTPHIGGKFPSVDAQQEWKQVLAPGEDYDPNLVGATGWVLNPKFAGSDVPFDHPFGVDWELMLALDQPYTGLLARGNQGVGDTKTDDEAFQPSLQQAMNIKDSNQMAIPVPQGMDMLPSFLAVEMDGGLVPQQFADQDFGVVKGDRMAVFGRWIVDCGHPAPVGGVDRYRSEIHPPLLMASARVTTDSLISPSPVSAPELTRVVFTSRPYLVSQRFSTNTDRLYDDNDPDDGPFAPHLVNELLKVNNTVPVLGIPLSSVLVEAHTKIKSLPFQGAHRLHLIVRPPPRVTPPLPSRLRLSYQFTVRSSCAVEVSFTGGDAIDVFITFNHAGHAPPPLPNRSTHNWTKDELNILDASSGKAFIGAEVLSALTQVFLKASPIGGVVVTEILGRGIQADQYDTGELTAVDILDTSRAITAFADNIPSTDTSAQLASLLKQRDDLSSEIVSDKGDLKELQSEVGHINATLLGKAKAKLSADEARLKQIDDQITVLSNVPEVGVLHNDNQPYPVYGWLEVSYVEP